MAKNSVLNKSLIELAEETSKNAKTLQEYLQRENSPQPTLAASVTQDEFLPPNHPEIRKVRDELRDASRQLNVLTARTIMS